MAPHSSTLAWKIPWTEEPGVVMAKTKKVISSYQIYGFFKIDFLNVNHFFTVFIEFVTILCLFYVLATRHVRS